MSDPADLVWINVVEEDFWWTSYIEGISFNGKQWAIEKALGMTDTGSSCSHIPSDYFHAVLD